MPNIYTTTVSAMARERTLAGLVATLHPAIKDTDDDTVYSLRAGMWPDSEGDGYVWLAGYFSEETDAWWCVGRGKTLLQAVRHLKRQLEHREPNEKRIRKNG